MVRTLEGDPIFKEMDDEERKTGVGVARYAYEHFEAAVLVDSTIGNKPGFEFVSPAPAFFLALHSVELSLEAYLRHNGVTVRQLRSKKYEHDIRACYRKAKELRLGDYFTMRADDLRAMLLLTDTNSNQALRYIRTGYRRYPSWSVVEPFVVRLHQAVSAYVGYRKTFDISYPDIA